MNYFTKKRLISWGIVLLVVMNISSLATVWFLQHRREPQSERGGPPPRMMPFLRNELQLADAQVEQISNLQRQHFDQVRVIRDGMRKLKQDLFGELSMDEPDVDKVNSLAQQVGGRHTELELQTFNHFLHLKQVCTPEQQKKLEALFDELLRGLEPQPGPPRRVRGRRPQRPGRPQGPPAGR